MAENQGQERTEEATPKRRREAEEKGDVARSRELTTFAVMLAGSGCALMLGGSMIGDLGGLLQQGFVIERAQVFDLHALTDQLGQATWTALAAVAPLFIVVAAAALIAPMALGGWVFSPKALGFKWSKLDPIKGLKRVFSSRGLMELAKALAKFALIASMGALILYNLTGSLLDLGREPAFPALAHAGSMLVWSFLGLSATLIVIALVDVPFQLWNHARQLRMTRQEVKDEFKETDGRPEVKSRVRALQREMAQRRMMEEVPKADVIVTNPTHYAIALRYDPDADYAPVVLAKGLDNVAAQIRSVAAAHRIPLVSAPPLARALYYSVRLNQAIPAGLYLAVAQVLAYVFQLRALTRGDSARPEPPTDLPIPDEFKR